MTLAVAAQFPWPRWIDAAPETSRAVWKRFPQFRPEPALIFSADSLWFYPTLGVAHVGAVKVAAIDKFGGATYAGNTDAGEVAIHWLSECFRDIRLGFGSEDLRDVLRSAWQKYRRGPDDGLQLAFGFFTQSWEPVLFRVDSWNGFLPLEILGTTVLGWPDAVSRFHRDLQARVDGHFEPREGRVIALSADHWATEIQTLVHSQANDSSQPMVGGPTSCLVIRRSGLTGIANYKVDVEEGQAEKISLGRGDVEQFYQHSLRRRRKLPFEWKWGHRPDSTR